MKIIGRAKEYLQIRWKYRWPVIPVAAVWSFLCYWRYEPDHTRALGCFKLSVAFVILDILFPFRWSSEKWKRKI
jgi:hypothetical protein